MATAASNKVKRSSPSPGLSAFLTWAAGIIALISLLIVAVELWQTTQLSADWPTELGILLLVATAPQFLVDWIAQAAESVARDELPKRVIKRGFQNLGAWVGVLERPLLLGSLIGGFPEFLAGWYVLKGVAGYRLGLEKEQLAERRSFQLFLINNALSFGGVLIGFVLWRAVGLSVRVN